MLIPKTELDSKGSRELIPLECLQCGKTHYRTKNLIQRVLNGNLKNTSKGCFCSRKCSYENKHNSSIYQCKKCGKEIIRNPSSIRGRNIFCSNSCAAYFNNPIKQIIDGKPIMKRELLTKNCLYCQKEFIGYRSDQKYCSQICSTKNIRKSCYEKIENGEINGHSSGTFRRYLIEKRGKQCELCGITEWGGKPLVVIMDHINGNSDDWSLTNLRLICSNCDSTLPTYKSKNKGNGRYKRRQRYKDNKSY